MTNMSDKRVKIAEVRNFFAEHKKQLEEQSAKVDAARVGTEPPSSALLFGTMKPLSRGEIMSSLPSKYITDLHRLVFRSAYGWQDHSC